MPCLDPRSAYLENLSNGKRKVHFTQKNYHGIPGKSIKLPCGQCKSCRLDRSRQWAVRLMHETMFHDSCMFLTLTYDDDHLPPEGTLVKKDFQDFMKRLRKRISLYDYDSDLDRYVLRNPVKFYHCGEYGSKLGRPHYHACLFGYAFPDVELYRITKPGFSLYTSKLLNEIWGKGFCIVGDVTFESAAYVARYIMKKITGDMAEDHYGSRQSEYSTCSRGLGKAFYEAFKEDVYPKDFVTRSHKGKVVKYQPPKYYDKLLEQDNPDLYHELKLQRQENAKKHEWNNTPDRLDVRKKCLEANVLSKLKRSYENEI